MEEVFPELIRKLPRADVPLAGVHAWLSQSDTHQILFMAFSEAVELPEHAHGSQWGVVLEGEIELTIGTHTATYRKGDRYVIPAGVTHAGRIRAGSAAMDVFGQPDRYRAR